MEECTYSMADMLQRRERICQARNLVMECMKIEAMEDGAMMTRFQNFFLQISFSELHPLMIFCFARPLGRNVEEECNCLNNLNLKSIYGSHAIDVQTNCYIYRATYWMDADPNRNRLHEILERLSEEAHKGFLSMTAI